jgi:hypothetical protein
MADPDSQGSTSATGGWSERLQRGFLEDRDWSYGRFVPLVLVAGFAVVTGVALDGAQLDCGKGLAAVVLAFTATGVGSAAHGCTAADVADHVRADWALIVLYGVGLALICWNFGPRGYRLRALRGASVWMGRLALSAGVLDVVENLILRWKLTDDFLAEPNGPDLWFNILTMAAWAKWVLIAVVGAYAVVAVFGYTSMPWWVRFDEDDDLPETEGETSPPHRDPSRTTAIAMSGGGVRSAVFGLGGLQALDRTPLGYDSATRVNSVSGGGYMAAGWALSRIQPSQDDNLSPWMDPGPEARHRGQVSPEERHLVDNLGYLLQSREGRPGALVTVLAGLVVNIAVLALLLFIVARPLGWLVGSEALVPGLRAEYGSVDRVFGVQPRHWGPPLLAAVTGGALLGLWVLASRVLRFGWLASLTRFLHMRLKPVVMASLGLAIVLALLLLVLPWLMIEVPEVLNLTRTEGRSTRLVVGAITAAIGSAVSVASVFRPLGSWLKRLGGLLLVLAALALGGQWASRAAVNGPDDDVVMWAWLTGGTLLGYWIANPEWWSLAPFYRGRLRLAYAYSRAKGDAFNGDDEPELTRLTPTDGPHPRPCPYFCGAVHVRSRRRAHENVDSPRHHDTNPALSFTMAPHQIAIHRPVVNQRTWVTEGCDPELIAHLMRSWENPKLNVMFCAAVSGAAVAPALGRRSQGSTDMLFAFTNVRLGVWMPNPRHARRVPDSALGLGPRESRWTKKGRSLPRVRINYLLKELFALHDPDDLYVYATDGGHWENTAIVETLRGSSVTEITAFDGSGVTADRTTPLAEAVNLAELELGDEIDIDIEKVRADPDGSRGGILAARNVAVGIVRRRDGGRCVLWYARPTLTRHSSAGLKAYAERDSDFPAHSTLDQFFDREQFENYRLLGFEAGRTIVRARSEVQRVMADTTDVGAFRQAAKGANWAVRELAWKVRDDNEFVTLRAIFEPDGGWGSGAPSPG